MKTVKQMLTEIMTAKGYDCQRLAQALGVDKSQVSRWFGGNIPKANNLAKIQKLHKEAVAYEKEQRINREKLI